jgi:8-oxo-dGTP pyrophosphatase MutT (NUDIX family)
MAKQRIRPIALCICRRGDRILVHQGHDSVKHQDFYRPLGGGIDFGESSQDAAARELYEELGAEVENLVLLGVVENRFDYNGEPGHEIVFLYDGQFTDLSLYDRPRLMGQEGDRTFEAQWVELAQIRQGEIPLYPPQLLALLDA